MMLSTASGGRGGGGDSSATVRAAALWVRAWDISDEDPSAAIALCQEVLDAETGNRVLEEAVRGYQLGLIARTDDVEGALEGLARSVDAWLTSSGNTYASGGVYELAAWLARRGYHDGAAHLYGACTCGRPETWSGPPPEIVALPDVMGEPAFTRAFTAGATLDQRAVAELAHELIAQLRTDLLGDGSTQ